MARQFPTYVHYIESDAKSKGEFIIRTVEPKFIARINNLNTKEQGFSIEVLEWWDPYYSGDNPQNEQHALKVIMKDAHRWFFNQIFIKKKSLIPYSKPIKNIKSI